MVGNEAEVPTAMRGLYTGNSNVGAANARAGRRFREALWTAAGELAREHGVNPVSRVLRLEFNHLKQVAESDRQRVHKRSARPTFVELVGSPTGADPICIVELQGQRGTVRIEWRAAATGPLKLQLSVVGDDRLIQITPQLRILVAIEAIDGRKGIDSLAQLCRERLDADPFSGCLFIFRSRSAKSIRILAYDGQGFWLATKRLSKGRFRWWPTGREAIPNGCARIRRSCCRSTGNPETEAAPVWRQVSR